MNRWLKRISKAIRSKEDTEISELAKEQSATTSSKNMEHVSSCSGRQRESAKKKRKYELH